MEKYICGLLKARHRITHTFILDGVLSILETVTRNYFFINIFSAGVYLCSVVAIERSIGDLTHNFLNR